ncbi:MAG: EF-P lysine aminoacylase GenX [Gammaproteobacteria bacterium]|nr:EF-P lysine aminoacylase GenX [Gammaproteobacteria bacterium]
MNSDNWRPLASREVLERRALLLRQIRSFMAERGVLEVETPYLGGAAATDPNIHSLTLSVQHPGDNRTVRRYLHSSPEFAMKRLLASGSGPIFQICRVFRDHETGRVHNPEFTMLEWYRPGFEHHRLMDEVNALLQSLGIAKAGRIAYGQAFMDRVGLDPHSADTDCLVRRAAALGFISEPADDAALLDFLFSELVAPALGRGGAMFVHDYPVHQAALARVRPGKPPVAERFELFINGVEIANGFHELTDAAEQRRRFERDNQRRRSVNFPVLPMEEHLLQALAHGLPECAGVALGVDRLLMTLCGAERLDQVLAFPFDRA